MTKVLYRGQMKIAIKHYTKRVCLNDMKKTCFCALIIFSFLLANGQGVSTKIDSINGLLQVKTGGEKLDLMMELVRINLDHDIKQALILSKRAQAIALQDGDSLHIVQFKRASGFIYRRMDSLSQSIRELTDALQIAKRNKFDDDQIKILNTLAIAYSLNGNHDKALECHFQAIDVNEKRGNKEDMAITYNNIGFVYFKLKDYERALDFYKKSLDVKSSISSNYDLDRLLINMALCYNQLKKYKEAEKFINRAIDICKVSCNPSVQIEAEFSLGISLSEQLRKQESISHFELSLKLARQQGDKRFQIENLLNLAIVKEHQGFRSEAIAFLKEAESIAISTNYSLSLIDVYKEFSKIYKSQSDFANSSKYQSKYIQLKDSIYSEDLIKNLAKVQTNYAERENIKTIKEKDQILELRQALINRQRIQYVFIIAITLLVLGLALVLLVANKRQQRASAELTKAKVLIEEQNRMLAEQNKELDARVKARTAELSKSNKMLIEVNSELDNFLYKTSHDIRGPLVTLKGLCNLALIEAKEPSLRDILDKLDGQSDKMAKILSRLTAVGKVNQSNLYPVKINFKAILDDVLKSEESNSQPKNIKVSYEVAHNVSMISDAELVTSILENLIDNGIKFYNNSSRVSPFVHVTVVQESNHVVVKVEDNGIGILNAEHDQVFHMFMRASERSETGGVGLYLSKICTDKLGGEIRLERSGKEGSLFVIQFPLDLNAVLAQRKIQEEELIKQFELAEQMEAKLKTTTT